MKRIKNLDHVRDLLRAEAKLEDIAKHIYSIELRPSGADDLKARCPFHDEKTASFGIRKSKQMYHCFGCKAGGDLFKFVERMDNIEHIDAVRKIAEFCNFDLGPHQEAYTEDERRLQELYNLNADVVEFAKTKGEPRVREWAKKRRLNYDILAGAFEVGYTSSLEPEDVPAAELKHAMALGFTDKGKWTERLTIPIKDQYGRVAGFRNKAINGEEVKMLAPHKEHPLPIPPLYGLYEARRYIRNAGFLILVEGEPDAWQMAAHGYRNVAAMGGSSLTESTLATLDSLSVPMIILLADADKAGRELSARVAEAQYGTNILIKIATLTGDGKDPDEVLLANGADKIGEVLADAKYSFEYLIDRTLEKFDITKTTEKLDALNELQPRFANSSLLQRELAARLLSTRLDIDYETIIDFFRESTAANKADLHNIKAERAVLKRILTDGEFVGEALLAVRAEDFYLSKHRALFEAVGRLYRSQESITEANARTYLENRTGESAAALFSSILNNAIPTEGVDYLLADIRDKAIRRTVAARAIDVANKLSNTAIDAKHTIQELSADISKAVSSGGKRVIEVGEIVQDRISIMHQRIANPNAIIGMDMGSDFPILNHTLHGLQASRYIVVSAPTGVGKTAFAGVLTRRIAVELCIPTLYCTFETGTEALTDRLIASDSGVESDKIVTGFINKAEAELVHDSAARIAASPLILTERGFVFEECVSLIRHDVLKRGTKFVVVDYIQLQVLAEQSSRLRRDQELGNMSRGYLELAHELDITVLVLAQQNRESAKSGAITNEGIGDSYQIVRDCDVFAAFREKTGEEIQADGPDKGNRVMRLGKHRHGKAGVQVNLIADLDVMRVREAIARRAPVV
jgi:DNA primase